MLLQRLRAALAPLGCTLQMASAPTARGAAVLACLADATTGELHAASLAQLERLLDAAPLWLIDSSRAHGAALDGMGLHTIGALRRLSRAGVVRRFGPALLDDIDTALGARCDPPPAWLTLPDSFEARIELQTRADTTDQLLHGAQWLIEPLLAWARAQRARVRRFTLFMHHERHRRCDPDVPALTELSIALAEPSCDAAHLSLLLRERLAHLPLPAPTLALRLHCADVVRGSPLSAELFASARGEREGLIRLIERLQARLGADQVRRLMPTADHRPECDGTFDAVSAEAVAVGAASTVRPAARRPSSTRLLADATPAPERHAAQAVRAPRPVWLFQAPQRLPEHRLRPLFDRSHCNCCAAPSASNRAGGTPRLPSAMTSSRRRPTVPWCGSTAPACRCRWPTMHRAGLCKGGLLEMRRGLGLKRRSIRGNGANPGHGLAYRLGLESRSQRASSRNWIRRVGCSPLGPPSFTSQQVPLSVQAKPSWLSVPMSGAGCMGSTGAEHRRASPQRAGFKNRMTVCRRGSSLHRTRSSSNKLPSGRLSIALR